MSKITYSDGETRIVVSVPDAPDAARRLAMAHERSALIAAQDAERHASEIAEERKRLDAGVDDRLSFPVACRIARLIFQEKSLADMARTHAGIARRIRETA